MDFLDLFRTMFTMSILISPMAFSNENKASESILPDVYEQNFVYSTVGFGLLLKLNYPESISADLKIPESVFETIKPIRQISVFAITEGKVTKHGCILFAPDKNKTSLQLICLPDNGKKIKKLIFTFQGEDQNNILYFKPQGFNTEFL
jgi:hypothetical protein